MEGMAVAALAAGESEELPLLRIGGCTEIGVTVSGMTWRSSAPTAINGMLVGIALAVLMVGFGGPESLNVALTTPPTSLETMAW
jgi:hypothetical protein